MILVSTKEKETEIIRAENKWAREEKDKTRPTWSAGAGPRERERRGMGGTKDEARPGAAGINGPGPGPKKK